MRSRRRICARTTDLGRLLVLSALAWITAGCGGEKSYHLSGMVTFKGQPVPTGHIVFEPDASAGNKGAPAYAKIKDGRYDTSVEEGHGTLGGPHIVLIHGRDGIPRGELLNGIPIFPDYSTTADLPKQNATLDFEVPATVKR
jgi:hypothetical protein